MQSVGMNIAARFSGVSVCLCVCGLILMARLRPISFYLSVAADVVEQ